MSNTQIKRIKIQNFKGLKAYEGEILGNDVYLTGKNASGKTSFIDAVWLALTGKNIPPKPVTTGAKKGVIEVELADGYIVRTKLATGKTPVSFEIENLNAVDEKDKFVKAPRTWLNDRIGVIDFNVNDFFKMSDAKQVEYFCKITGVDVYELDQQIEEHSDNRKFDKKKLVELLSKAGFFQPEEAEKSLVNVVELAEKIAVLKEAERVKAEDWQRVTEAEVEGAYIWLDEAGNKPVPSDVLAGLENDFRNSEQINAKIAEAKGYKEADEAIEKLQEAIQEATDGITENKDKKAVVISEKINIEGLSYDIENECFLFNALPFDRTQINTAAQLIAGLKIGASLLNEVKILKIDASLIDKENFAKVKEWTAAEGIELFVELVDREAGSLKIEIEENVSE
jgi:predicted ATP-binding protein involved in virulence